MGIDINLGSQDNPAKYLVPDATNYLPNSDLASSTNCWLVALLILGIIGYG
jgi:hypothetical protein